MSVLQQARVRVGALVVSLGLTACTVADGASGPPAEDSRALEIVWKAELKPFSQPVDVAGVAVMYAFEGREMVLLGFDPTTGERLWRRPASPSTTPLNVNFFLDTFRDADGEEYVAYLRPSVRGNLYAVLVVGNPRTGNDVYETDPMYFAAPPLECADGHDVCVTARKDWEKDDFRPYRLRLGDGRFAPEKGAPKGSRSLTDDGLFAMADRDPELLGYLSEGRVRWRTPVEKAFPAGATTRNGSTMTVRREDGVALGSVGVGVTQRGKVSHWDLAKWTTTALDLADGGVRWAEPATYAYCNNRVYASMDPDDADAEMHPVRCRYAGTADWRDGEARYHDLEVTVEGFDIETGETTWSVPLGPRGELVFDERQSIRLGRSSYLFETPDGQVVVDLATGESRRPTDADAFYCFKTLRYDYREAYYVDEKPHHERRGGSVPVPCDTDGRRVQRSMDADIADSVGTRIGDHVLVAERAGLVGYTAR